jgi:hypothetical protein
MAVRERPRVGLRLNHGVTALGALIGDADGRGVGVITSKDYAYQCAQDAERAKEVGACLNVDVFCGAGGSACEALREAEAAGWPVLTPHFGLLTMPPGSGVGCFELRSLYGDVIRPACTAGSRRLADCERLAQTYAFLGVEEVTAVANASGETSGVFRLFAALEYRRLPAECVFQVEDKRIAPVRPDSCLIDWREGFSPAKVTDPCKIAPELEVWLPTEGEIQQINDGFAPPLLETWRPLAGGSRRILGRRRPLFVFLEVAAQGEIENPMRIWFGGLKPRLTREEDAEMCRVFGEIGLTVEGAEVEPFIGLIHALKAKAPAKDWREVFRTGGIRGRGREVK